jgi:hypothetical protein
LNEINDVALGAVCVAILKLKYLFDSVVSEGSATDKQFKLSGQVLTQNEVLLASDLQTVSSEMEYSKAAAVLTPSRRESRLFLAASRMWSASRSRLGAMIIVTDFDALYKQYIPSKLVAQNH